MAISTIFRIQLTNILQFSNNKLLAERLILAHDGGGYNFCRYKNLKKKGMVMNPIAIGTNSCMTCNIIRYVYNI